MSGGVPGFAPAFAAPRLALAGSPLALPVAAAVPSRRHLRARRRLSFRLRAFVEAHPRFVGCGLGAALFAAVGLCGSVYGGEYATFVETYGSVPDVMARGLGFGIKAITISGMSELSETEVLSIAGISERSSLAFLDAVDVRRRLKQQPMVQEASVTKLYPNRLMIALTEREPFALWQKDGQVAIIGRDGLVIDDRRDDRHDGLPFVTGEGANTHIADYVKLIAAAGDLRSKIRAGVLVAERRWDLVMASGVLVKLPELNGAEALANLATVEHDSRVLEKDVVSIDLRMPGRLVARLTDEAAAARDDLFSRKAGKRRGPT